MVRAFLAVWLALVSVCASADSVPPTQGAFTSVYQTSGGAVGQGATMAQACQNMGNIQFTSGFVVTCSYWSNSGAYAYYKVYRDGALMPNYAYINDSAQTVICPSGYDYNSSTGMCDTAAPACTADEQFSAGYYDVGTSDTGMVPTTACDGGCDTVYDGGGVAFTKLVGGVPHYFTFGRYVKSGANCSTGSASPAAVNELGQLTCTAPQVLNLAGDACVSDPNPNSTCPSGQVKIGFMADGQPICENASTADPISCPSGYSPNDTNTACYKTVTSCPVGQTAKFDSAGNYYCVNNTNSCLADNSCTTSDAAAQVNSNGTSTTAGTAVSPPPAGAVSGVGDLSGEDLTGLPDASAIEHKSFAVNYQALVFAENNNCPAAVEYTINMPIIGGTRSISWQPFCDWALDMRPLILALGAISAAFIFVAGIMI